MYEKSEFSFGIVFVLCMILLGLSLVGAANEISEYIPTELFDIKMDLENTVIKSIDELRAVVTYESFGRIPTPVDLTFEIFDGGGNSVYFKKGDIVVSVEEVRRYDFPDLVLEPGKYQFIFKTIYNVDVFDEFKQSFTLLGEKSFFEKNLIWIILVGAIFIGGIAFFVLKKKK